jgi:hypothetical protein
MLFCTNAGKALGFFDVNSSDTAELLRPDEHKFFSDGLPSYYEHIMDLLSLAKAHSHIVDFAKMALQAHAQAERRADQVLPLISYSIYSKTWANSEVLGHV